MIATKELHARITRRAFFGGAFSALAVTGTAALAFAGPGEPPDGHGPQSEGGEPPDMPDGQGGVPGGGGPDTMTYDYSGTYTAAVEAVGTDVSVQYEDYFAELPDQNAFLAWQGGVLDTRCCTFTKTGDDQDGDVCNFYGVNSIGVAVGEGSTVVIEDAKLAATSVGSNAVFSTDGAKVFANRLTIETGADNSRGLDATYGGTIVANDVSITTYGDHCAAVANDRGGGYVSVVDSSFETNGSGSPLLYSTGDIEVCGVTGLATASQIAGMEGKNTILIKDCDFESSMTRATASDPVANAVIVYQSMSGDAEATTGERATFKVVGSRMATAITEGTLFYVTNTSADIVITNTQLEYDSASALLLYAAGNDANNWGTPGSNGANLNFTGVRQDFLGDVVVDTASQAEVFLLDKTTWQGASGIEENAYATGSESVLGINVDATSKWVVTSDSYVSTLNIEEGGAVVDVEGNAVSVVVGGQIAREGTSGLTVYASEAFGNDVFVSSASAVENDVIDRSEFDQTFSLDTVFQFA